MFFGVGVSCRKLYSFVVYLYVNGSGSIASVGEERAICLLLFTCNYVVFVWRGFLFLWVVGMGYVILLWHSLSLPYNYLVYNFKKIIGNPNFSNLLKRIVNRFKRAGYSLDIMRQTACLVFNPILVEGYAALFSCTAVVQASDSMTASM